MIKTIRIILLILIIIGLVLLFTQKFWVPKLVDKILSSETSEQAVIKIPNPIPSQSDKTECSKNSDCSNGASCMVEGPLIANQPVRKVCVPKGQVAPL
jgi:hypothetical protein